MKEILLEEFKFDGDIIGQKYERLFFISVNHTINFLTEYLNEDCKHKVLLNGIEIKTSTDRLKKVTLNINNFREDIKPLFFSVERIPKDKKFHLNLYGINENGVVLMLNQNDIKGKVIRWEK